MRSLTLASILSFCAACASAEETTAGGTPPGEPGAEPGSACGLINETQSCSCGERAGAQACTEQGWTLCACGSASGTDGWQAGDFGPTPPGNLRSDIKFAWERTEPSKGSCEPGNYTGEFTGLYASGLTFVNAPIPVFSLGTGLTPGLEFTLEQSADGETLRIANGKMTGTADGLFPFNGTIEGSLNCKTNKFEAILDGYYSLGLDGIGKFHFKGPIIADYDQITHTMVNGTWDVEEYDPPPVLPGAGGWGTWSASWVP